jgi:hypothetical protein
MVRTLRKNWSLVLQHAIAQETGIPFASVGITRCLIASADLFLLPLSSRQSLAISLSTGSARQCGFRLRHSQNFVFLATPGVTVRAC